MHKLLNFFSFPTAIIGLILASSGLLGINPNKIEIHTNVNTSNQINKLYSEKEIILKGPPVSEVLSEKIIVKIRSKPLNPKIILNIENNKVGDVEDASQSGVRQYGSCRHPDTRNLV